MCAYIFFLVFVHFTLTYGFTWLHSLRIFPFCFTFLIFRALFTLFHFILHRRCPLKTRNHRITLHWDGKRYECVLISKIKYLVDLGKCLNAMDNIGWLVSWLFGLVGWAECGVCCSIWSIGGVEPNDAFQNLI